MYLCVLLACTNINTYFQTTTNCYFYLSPKVDLIRLGFRKQHHKCVSLFQARSLIPSLEGRFSEEELGGLLEDIQTKRPFQY